MTRYAALLFKSGKASPPEGSQPSPGKNTGSSIGSDRDKGAQRGARQVPKEASP